MSFDSSFGWGLILSRKSPIVGKIDTKVDYGLGPGFNVTCLVFVADHGLTNG